MALRESYRFVRDRTAARHSLANDLNHAVVDDLDVSYLVFSCNVVRHLGWLPKKKFIKEHKAQTSDLGDV